MALAAILAGIALLGARVAARDDASTPGDFSNPPFPLFTNIDQVRGRVSLECLARFLGPTPPCACPITRGRWFPRRRLAAPAPGRTAETSVHA